MKINLFKLYILGFFLLSNFTLFAQFPGDDQGGGGLEGADPVSAPIDGKLVWLGIAAILFALYRFKSKNKEA
ncbi:signal peptidase [Flavobacterium psychrotolerans]|uniref:Signal peptidase n=1 Tax=Flavobacterium psychrotolerans TaxID=2169410 RepID=A0A2U1JH50_9FLAO|nr:signal peptidase [Flavobacterium psychrotolerans]PWA04193.1 signal peptidase [Flavobacterium psychrotolerans]